jgi:hypothetical protein
MSFPGIVCFVLAVVNLVAALIFGFRGQAISYVFVMNFAFFGVMIVWRVFG